MDLRVDEVMDPIEIIKKHRRDAENPERDKIPGVDALRSWMRHLHCDLMGIDAQSMTQDEIAEALGENPRDHPRAFKIPR